MSYLSRFGTNPHLHLLIKDKQRLVTEKIIWKNDFIYGIVIMIKTNMLIIGDLPYNLIYLLDLYERKQT